MFEKSFLICAGTFLVLLSMDFKISDSIFVFMFLKHEAYQAEKHHTCLCRMSLYEHSLPVITNHRAPLLSPDVVGGI